jgi:Reverse transcriptase (RNA-dependent DNA polymerase)
MLAFVDDLVLVAPSSSELQLLFNCFAAFCEVNNLHINIDKTKAMYVNCEDNLLLN